MPMAAMAVPASAAVRKRHPTPLTTTVDLDCASLAVSLNNIQTLKDWGITTVVFVTNGATSTFALNGLLEQGSTGEICTQTITAAR